jgi:DNA double-strand break repair helicase HerA and related ATPase
MPETAAPDFSTTIASESAREKLAARTAAAAEGTPTPVATPPAPTREHKEAGKAAGGGAEVVADFLKSRQGKALQRQVIRGVFGMLRKRL